MIMKRLLSVLLSLWICFAAFANPIDVETGKKVAQSFISSISKVEGAGQGACRNVSDTELVLIYESPKNTRSAQQSSEFYVFSPTDSIGFVIVSGDDAVAPIVGYSLSSMFPSQDMPPALGEYLSSYGQYIRRVWDGVSEPRRQSKEETVPVFPFIRTTWNQGYPYNKYCPTIKGKSTYTGCVATALAQIMKYYEWPKRGHGACTATLNDGYDTAVSITLTASYDWENMIDNYYPSNSYTATQANAVAQLMKDVGYACGVSYGVDVTWGYSYNAVKALLRHFDYSPEIRLVDRNYYSDKAWNDMIYGELRVGRPVWYRGADIDDNGGHFFLCTGVDQGGRYYINWGWGGWCDGYFDLDAIVPDGYDYRYYQQAIINIKPIAEDEHEEDYSIIPHVGRLEITEQDNSLVAPQVTYTIYVTNMTDQVISGQTGYAIYMNGTMVSDGIKELQTYDELYPGWYWWYSGEWFSWDDATDLSRGMREIRFYWRPMGDTKWHEPFGEHTIYMLTTEEGHYFTTNREDFGEAACVDTPQTDELCITPIEGGVVLTAPQSMRVNICAMSGVVVKELILMPSRTEICRLPRGLYVVNGQKIVVK